MDFPGDRQKRGRQKSAMAQNIYFPENIYIVEITYTPANPIHHLKT
jgi:hypothetical protein